MNGRLTWYAAAAGTLIMVLLILVGGATYPGYSHATRYISELGARQAPHGALINWFGLLPAGVLLLVFCCSAAASLRRNAATLAGWFGLDYYAFGYVVAAIFPCVSDCRPDSADVSQVLHELIGGMGYITGPTALLVLGWQAGNWPRAAHLRVMGFAAGSIGLCCALLLSPDLMYVGLVQRCLELVILVWILACARYVRMHQTAA